MAKAFIFKQPQLTVTNKTTKEVTVIGDENFAEDGVTINISSDAREISRFNGTDKFASGIINVDTTVATILEGDDLWKLFKVFAITGIATTTLANDTTGFTVGSADTYGTSDEIEVVVEDKCRAEADVQKRIKLTNIEANAEDIELALNNSDGITPTFNLYCHADANGVKLMGGFDDAPSA